MNDGAIVFSASVINIFTDFLVTTLPMPLIWSLKLPARQRLAVISIFGLGVVVNVAGSVRTVYVWKSMVVGYDATWLGWPVLIAATVEISLGLVKSQPFKPPSNIPLTNNARSAPRHQPSAHSLQPSSPASYNRPVTSALLTTRDPALTNCGLQPAALATLVSLLTITASLATTAIGLRSCAPLRWRAGPSRALRTTIKWAMVMILLPRTIPVRSVPLIVWR
jgi:hypothetical protein